jgi:hypothetical protein
MGESKRPSAWREERGRNETSKELRIFQEKGKVVSVK